MPTVSRPFWGAVAGDTPVNKTPMWEVGKGSNEDSFRGGLAVSGTSSSEVLISLPISLKLSHM